MAKAESPNPREDVAAHFDLKYAMSHAVGTFFRGPPSRIQILPLPLLFPSMNWTANAELLCPLQFRGPFLGLSYSLKSFAKSAMG